MKEITSKAFRNQGLSKIQIVTDAEWENIVARGWERKYKVKDVPEKKLSKVPLIEPAEKPIELNTKTKNKNG
jgi:hypothetical protein